MPRNLQGSPDQRKQMRETLFTDCDWMTWRQEDQIKLGVPTSLTSEQYLELLTYRQALREWPVTGDYNEAFPTKPEWMQG